MEIQRAQPNAGLLTETNAQPQPQELDIQPSKNDPDALKFGTADAEADIEDDKEFASPASANNLSLNSRIQEYNKIYPNCTKSMKETSNNDGCSDNMKYSDNNP